MSKVGYPKRIWFIRHGESLKNIKNIHGGSGDCLTENGINQCNTLVKRIKSDNFERLSSIVIGHDVKQVMESINIYSAGLECDFRIDDRLRGIHLGIANGISKDELVKLSPNDANMLELWRSKKISISEFHVTGMETADSFYTRISTFLSSCFEDEFNETFVIVCTTSVMIILINIIILQDRFDFRLYHHFDVDAGDFICVNVVVDKMELLESSIDLDDG